jgi:adenylate kinase
MTSIRIAITGAPGAGKSAFCAEATTAGWPRMTVLELADEAGLAGPIDESDDARPIDVEMLTSKLALEWHRSNPDKNNFEKLIEASPPTLIDGHISHLLPVDAVCIIRCNPLVLRTRLEARGYPEWKVETNVEWELLGSAWADINASREEYEQRSERKDERNDKKDDYRGAEGAVKEADWRRVFEIDSTIKSPEECFKEFVLWLDSGAPSTEPMHAIDWIVTTDID